MGISRLCNAWYKTLRGCIPTVNGISGGRISRLLVSLCINSEKNLLTWIASFQYKKSEIWLYESPRTDNR